MLPIDAGRDGPEENGTSIMRQVERVLADLRKREEAFAERPQPTQEVGQFRTGCMEEIARALLEASMIIKEHASLGKKRKRWLCSQLAHASKHLTQFLAYLENN